MNDNKFDPVKEAFEMLNQYNLEQAKLYREAKLVKVKPVIANDSGHAVRHD